MDNFNKVISFILGLIVVVVLLVILTGRFNLRERFLPLKGAAKTSPTPTKTTARTTPQPTKGVTITNPDGTVVTYDYNYHSYRDGNQGVATNGATTKGGLASVNAIPKTGAPTLLLPLAFTALAGGIFLRRKK